MLALESFVRERGLPAMLSTALGRRGLSDWTPLQARAWRAGADRPDSDWLVTAPTSAGKSLVAELRSARHLARSEKVVWLAPTRALADATARQLAADFAPCGWRVALATGDAPDGDAALARGSFDLLVTVPEKALAWLAREPHALAGVGLVVVDELPLLGDPERGPRFDLLLALIRHSPYAPRRLALAPPLGEGRAAAAWWGGRWLDEPSRPRPLHEGVLDVRTGRFRWRDRAAGEAGELPLIPPEVLLECLSRAAATVGIDDHPPLRALTGALAGTLAARGEPTLLFAPTRAMARTWALGLAGALEPTLDPELLGRLNRLARLEPCSDLAAAAAAAAGGVGLHHADLPAPARQAVEEAFTDGKLNLVVATPTLAHGVNLRARNVVLWPHAPGGGPRRAAWLPLERYHDQAGRAGRMGWGEGPGRSILVAWDGAAAERLWDRFIAPPPPPLRSALALAGLAPLLPPALAGDVARTRPNLLALMASTLGGTQRPADELGGLEWALDQALADCDAAHLLRPRADAAEPHRLSSRGQIAALHGLAPGQARHLGRVAEESPPGEDPLPCLWGLALAAPPATWPGARPGRSTISAEARAWFRQRDLRPPGWLAERLDRPGGPEPEDLAALEAGARLARWIGPEPTVEIEHATGWSAGMLQRAGEALAALAAAAAELAALRGLPATDGARWRELAARLRRGLPAGAAELGRLDLPDLGRTGLLRLWRDGLASVDALRDAPEQLLAERLEDARLARRVRLRVAAIESPCGLTAMGGEETARGPAGAPAELDAHREPTPEPSRSGPAGVGCPTLAIDLTSPCLVRVGEREVRLNPLGFDLLVMLAEEPGRVVQRDALYHRLWGEDGPEDQQLDRHRRLVEAALRPALNGDGPRPVIEVVRGVGFRLALPAAAVRVRT